METLTGSQQNHTVSLTQFTNTASDIKYSWAASNSSLNAVTFAYLKAGDAGTSEKSEIHSATKYVESYQEKVLYNL